MPVELVGKVGSNQLALFAVSCGWEAFGVDKGRQRWWFELFGVLHVLLDLMDWLRVCDGFHEFYRWWLL